MTLGAAFDASVAALRHAAADVPTVLSPADISELLHGLGISCAPCASIPTESPISRSFTSNLIRS